FKLGKVDKKKLNKTEEIRPLQSRIKTINQIKNKNSKQIQELTALLNQQAKLISELQIKNTKFQTVNQNLISRLESLEKFASNNFENPSKSLAKK
ncbi:hypothetical protein, partial [Prochlorococcus marinus]|uniref:hypothetical protein n=1 Tax=Prochlorococcus marinus TaxID=1219 RepID=UPI000B22DD6F